MSDQGYSLTDLILDNLFNIRGLFSHPYGVSYALAKKQREVSYREFGQTVSRMRSRKLVIVTEKNSQRFIKLTKHGELEALLLKSKLDKTSSWDGKWRLFIFDIPEDSKEQRNFLRGLLKKNGFHKLQNSVYISPYTLNREAIRYLNNSGLHEYIRILKVEEMDSDEDLLKRFDLKRPNHKK
jgi:CRISPR-associated endonuclease Cas2